MRRVLLLVMSAGCAGGSTSVTDAGGGDAAQAAPRCDPRAPFQTPVPLIELNTQGHDESATLSADELSIYFSSTRPGGAGGFDVFVATRPTRDARFGVASPVRGVNTAGSERSPVVTEDGRSLYVWSGTFPDSEIAVAERSTAREEFGRLSVIPVINSANNDVPGTATGGALYLSSDHGGSSDLYRVARTNGAFGAPMPVAGPINTASAEVAPVVSADELTLFFASERPDGLGRSDVYAATRASAASEFGKPALVERVSSPDYDVPSWVSADGCVLYLTRMALSGGADLYVATRGN